MLITTSKQIFMDRCLPGTVVGSSDAGAKNKTRVLDLNSYSWYKGKGNSETELSSNNGLG